VVGVADPVVAGADCGVGPADAAVVVADWPVAPADPAVAAAPVAVAPATGLGGRMARAAAAPSALRASR
jgi:hypothetical protein